MRTVATFKSDAFNKSVTREHFINPNCFGDDVARWLIKRLREAAVDTDAEPSQEDFGWYFNFSVPEGRHCCVLGYRPGDADDRGGEWIAWLERSRGFLGSLLGRRDNGIAPSAVVTIHGALSSSPEIRGIRWHLKRDFDANREDLSSERP
jgi:hypothetical protein